MNKTRKNRSDIQVGNLEKKHKLKPGTVRNPDQSDARSDKELGTLQREFGEQALEGVLAVKSIETDTPKPGEV